MSQRYRRQQRRWSARLDVYYRYFLREAVQHERKEKGWLTIPYAGCGLPHHRFRNVQLIHKGRKP